MAVYIMLLAFLGIIIIASVVWQFYTCVFLSRASYQSRSFTHHILHPVRSPLHPSLFDLLPTSTYSSSPGADEHSQAPPECAICLDDFKEGDTGRLLPNCNHFFHLNCIDEWLRTNKTCPLCREVVKPPPRIPPPHENAEASAGEEGQLQNSSNVNLLPPIWCPGNTNTRQQVIESEQVVIDIPEEDHRRSHRLSTC
ncbi:hypothetical protein K1719_029861 [Acacia pycnantha]|nr:hypothetical protein K1719_029861 [Acacia pycnantha]